MKKTIIYILGSGRSGTTLLDIVLGNSLGILSCGELMRFVETRGKPPECTTDSENYRFWSRITDRMSRKYAGRIDFNNLLRIIRGIEYHRSLLRTYFGMLADGNISEYKTYNRHLFDSIFETVSETVIVDSSKWPSRALALYKYLDYDICFIYLVRNPVMVVKSFGKAGIEQDRKGYISANIYYFLVNSVCKLVLRKLRNARTVTVRYEDLIANPEGALEHIQNELKVDLSKSISLIKQGKHLQVANLFEGNRIRHKSAIKLRQSKEKPMISGIKDRLTMIINWVWWRQYR